MNITINPYNQKNNQSFGTLTKNAKELIQNPNVKNILIKKYKIGYNEIKNLERSRLRFGLLSDCVPEGQLPKTSGLIVSTSNNFITNTIVSVPEIKLSNSDNDFFAYCVSKAVKMEKSYSNTLKKMGSHPENVEFRKNILKFEGAVKKAIKNFSKGYNKGDNLPGDAEQLSQNLKSLAVAEKEYSIAFRPKKARIDKIIKTTVDEEWNSIKREKL